MRSNWKRIARFKALAALVLAGMTLAACQKKAEAKAAQESGTAVRKVVVGSGMQFNPYCYLDDDGNLAGYEKAVLDAVDALLPEYEFSYLTMSFPDILLSIDSGKVNIGAHEFERNPERVQNYLFGKVPYNNFDRYIVVLESSDYGIGGIDDLGGKRVLGMSGDNAVYFFQDWNAAHPDNPMLIQVVSEPSFEERLAGLISGRGQAFSDTKHNVRENFNAAFPNTPVKIVGEPHIITNTYFVFKKGDTQLQQAVDAALIQLIKSGELEKISIREIGDYSLTYTPE